MSPLAQLSTQAHAALRGEELYNMVSAEYGGFGSVHWDN